MLTGFSKQQLSSEVDNKIHDSLTNKYWVIDIAFERLGKNEKEESTHSLFPVDEHIHWEIIVIKS